jgi:DNA replication protein DnaC
MTGSVTRPVIAGFAMLAVLVLGLGGWAAFSSIAGAVVASGRVEVQNQRQILQHLDGGMVEKLFVKEGDVVAAGQPILQIDGTALLSERAMTDAQYFEVLARSGRLEAERDGRQDLEFRPELRDRAAADASVAELMRGAFVDQRESVILLGNPGTGKTHLATALAMEACRRGKRVRFWRVIELVTHLMEAREERNLLRLKSQLDELGYVPTSKVGAELLFDVISTAYERTSIIVTTNLPFEQWTEVLGSERLVGATLDRLTHRCHILEATGESYRLKDAKRRQRRGSSEDRKGGASGGD